MTPRKRKNQGMNWIRQEKRLAIYIRDGLECAYCGSNIEDTKLTLDHLIPYSMGGSNDQTNLVTCCHRCNSSRGTRDWRLFAESVAAYQNTSSSAIIEHITTTVQKPIDVPQAKKILAERRARNDFKKK